MPADTSPTALPWSSSISSSTQPPFAPRSWQHSSCFYTTTFRVSLLEVHWKFLHAILTSLFLFTTPAWTKTFFCYSLTTRASSALIIKATLSLPNSVSFRFCTRRTSIFGASPSETNLFRVKITRVKSVNSRTWNFSYFQTLLSKAPWSLPDSTAIPFTRAATAHSPLHPDIHTKKAHKSFLDPYFLVLPQAQMFPSQVLIYYLNSAPHALHFHAVMNRIHCEDWRIEYLNYSSWNRIHCISVFLKKLWLRLHGRNHFL